MNNKKIYGLFFMAVAVFTLIAQLNIRALQSSSMIIWTVIFGLFLIRGILKMSWFMISVSAFLIINMYNNIYNFLPFSPMILFVIMSVFFLGVSMVFKKQPSSGIKIIKNPQKNYKQHTLSTVTKYIDDKDLEDFTYIAKLSQATIYFDNADLKNDTAVFHLEVKVSELTLYIPKHWAVINEMKVILGEINQSNKEHLTTKTIYLRGKVAVGELNIIYV